MLMSIPHLELLGVVGCIGIASIAAWSSAAVNMRMRMLERDIDDLYDEMQALRQEHAYLAAQPAVTAAPVHSVAPPVPVAMPARQPRRSATMTRPTQPAMLPTLSHQYAAIQASDREIGAAQPVLQRPNVEQLATQLAAQTPAQMDEVLTPAIDLGASYSTLGAGRQESRLLRWMNGVTGQFSTIRQ